MTELEKTTLVSNFKNKYYNLVAVVDQHASIGRENNRLETSIIILSSYIDLIDNHNITDTYNTNLLDTDNINLILKHTNLLLNSVYPQKF